MPSSAEVCSRLQKSHPYFLFVLLQVCSLHVIKKNPSTICFVVWRQETNFHENNPSFPDRFGGGWCVTTAGVLALGDPSFIYLLLYSCFCDLSLLAYIYYCFNFMVPYVPVPHHFYFQGVSGCSFTPDEF